MFKPFPLALLAAATAATAALAAPGSVKLDRGQAFDGRWSIEVVTERGSCDRAYRYGVRIENGQARYDGGADFTISGRVAANGAVKGSIARGDQRAEVVGRLDGEAGGGSWTTNGPNACSGIWNAERRG